MQRILITGVIFTCIIITVGSFVWSRQVKEEIKQSEFEHEKFLSKIKEEEKQEPIDADLTLKDTYLNSTSDSLSYEWTSFLKEVREKQERKTQSNVETQNDGSLSLPLDENKLQSDLRTSPFGFGPYPKIPEDYPYDVAWENPGVAKMPSSRQRTFEILSRVRVKLWNNGERDITGLKFDINQKVYLLYPRTVYVRYSKLDVIDDMSNGSPSRLSVISDSFGGGDITPSEYVKIAEGETPESIRILDYDSEGIDPYEFLGLK